MKEYSYDENYGKNFQIQVPDFVLNPDPDRRRELSENLRNNSISVKPVSSNKKGNRSVSFKNKLKHDLLWMGVGASLGSVVLAGVNYDNLKTYFEEQKITHEVLNEFFAHAIAPNRHTNIRYINGYSAPVTGDDGNVTYYYDSSAIGKKMSNLIANGVSEEEVIYSAYATMINTDSDVDDFYAAMNSAGLSSEKNAWALDHGYTDMNDPRFEKDAERKIVQRYYEKAYHKSQEMDEMLKVEYTDSFSEQQSIGGK